MESPTAAETALAAAGGSADPSAADDAADARAAPADAPRIGGDHGHSDAPSDDDDDDDEDDVAPLDDVVHLGFMTAATRALGLELASPYFPSKVGGRPAWLDLSAAVPRLQCSKCDGPLAFLLQIYCPWTELDRAFHRTLFLFCCRKGHEFRAVRSQLALDNEFYPSEPAEEALQEDPTPAILRRNGVKLCALCGCRAPKMCTACREVHYCCREHQVLHWKAGHKAVCSNRESEPVVDTAALQPYPVEKTDAARFKEFELEMDEELLPDDSATLAEENRRYAELIEAPDEESRSNDESHQDRCFLRFQKITAHYPDQCIRYVRMDGAAPLFVSGKDRPRPPPPCERCGAARIFELQVLPQVLYYLDLPESDPLDWGSLYVYSCSESCDIDGYHPEVVVRQMFTDDDPMHAEMRQKAQAAFMGSPS